MAIGKPPFETNDVKLTYRRIKMNAYSFPDTISLSEDLKDLISSILVNDPMARPSLDDILNSNFFAKNTVPKLLPASTLAVPPSSSYLKQFELGSQPKEEIRLSRPPRSASQTRVSDDLRGLSREDGKLTERDGRVTSRTSSRADSASNGPATSRKVATISCYNYSEGGPNLWVMKWVDYSNKYGLGYMLSNGCAGVYFNDSTKIISSSNGESFQYISKLAGGKEESMTNYSSSAFPADLQKKVTLLQHFRKHLNIEKNFGDESKELVYVKK